MITNKTITDNTHILFFSEPHGYIGYNYFKFCDKIFTEQEVERLKTKGMLLKQEHHLGFKDICIAASFFSKKELAKMKKEGYSCSCGCNT